MRRYIDLVTRASLSEAVTPPNAVISRGIAADFLSHQEKIQARLQRVLQQRHPGANAEAASSILTNVAAQSARSGLAISDILAADAASKAALFRAMHGHVNVVDPAPDAQEPPDYTSQRTPSGGNMSAIPGTPSGGTALPLPSPSSAAPDPEQEPIPGATSPIPGNVPPGEEATPVTPPSAGGATPPPPSPTSPGKSADAPGHSGAAPGQSGSAPGQTGTTPGQSGTAPGKAKEQPGDVIRNMSDFMKAANAYAQAFKQDEGGGKKV